jgi:cytoskeletal protein CcmA (bactofilin family)
MGLFSRTPRVQHEMLDSVIGPTANMSGTIRSDGGLRIEGHFEGLVEVAGNVVITEGARVAADITARNITVGGAVKGNIYGTGRLEILATGQVVGDITVASVMIDDGGIFQGISRMRGYEQRALQAPMDTPAAPPRVYVEEPVPPPERVETMDLQARTAGESAAVAASAPGPTPEPSPAPAEAPAAKPQAKAAKAAKAPDPAPEIDFDDIEPVIPDIVIEEPQRPPPTPPSRRRGRR